MAQLCSSALSKRALGSAWISSAVSPRPASTLPSCRAWRTVPQQVDEAAVLATLGRQRLAQQVQHVHEAGAEGLAWGLSLAEGGADHALAGQQLRLTDDALGLAEGLCCPSGARSLTDQLPTRAAPTVLERMPRCDADPDVTEASARSLRPTSEAH